MVAQASKPRLPLWERGFLRFSKGTCVDGVWIGSCGNDAAEVARVVSALALIQLHDRRRYARLTQDLRRIWVVPLIGCIGDFDPAEMMCRIDNKYLADLSIEEIASAIVHEATHARLWTRNIGYPEELRFRIERACMRRELAFARRLPDSAARVAKIEAGLSWAQPDTWSDESMTARVEANAHQRAREAGIPDWVTSILIKIAAAVRAARGRSGGSRKATSSRA